MPSKQANARFLRLAATARPKVEPNYLFLNFYVTQGLITWRPKRDLVSCRVLSNSIQSVALLMEIGFFPTT
jgi:hypothetical protein